MGRGPDREAALAIRKVAAGADFLITQPIFDANDALRFRESYRRQSGADLPVPVFYGLQILELDGVTFSPVPGDIQAELDAGCSGVDLALELYRVFLDAELCDIYLMPPIRRGGARDYGAAREFLVQALP